MQIGPALGSFSERNRFESWLIYHICFPKPKEQGRTPRVHSMDVHYRLTFPSVGLVFGSADGQEAVAPA